jgi:DNA-binding IclR family transcriptional regulator
VPLPLSVGAGAKVLLSEAASEVFRELAVHVPSIDLAGLATQLAAVRERGYAVSHGEREVGASAVAAPIRGRRGQIVAALSLSGPTSRFTAGRVDRYAGAVVSAADEITRAGVANMEAIL